MYKWLRGKYTTIVNEEEGEDAKYVRLCRNVLRNSHPHPITDYPGCSFHFDLSEGEIPMFCMQQSWYTILSRTLQLAANLKYSLPHDIVCRNGINFLHITLIRGELSVHYHCSKTELTDIPQVVTETALLANILAHVNGVRPRDATVSFDFIRVHCSNSKRIENDSNACLVNNFPRLVITRKDRNLCVDDFKLVQYQPTHI